MTTPIDLVTEALENQGSPVRNGSARCPAHDDKNPSLSINEGADGKVILYCHRGCATEAIVEALHLKMTDLFPPKVNGTNGHKGDPIARYPYTDELGELLYTVLRFEPKSFAQVPASGRKGKGAMDGVRLVLYRLPKVIDAVAQGHPVFIVEGEKDVEALERAGHVATCNPAGAGKWGRIPDAVFYLTGAKVFIVADADENGYRHARDVANSLFSVAQSITILEAAHGKDASDHFASGFTAEEFDVVAGDYDGCPTVAEWLEGPAPDPVDEDDLSIDLDELLATEEPDYDWQVPGLLERMDRVIFTGPEGGGKSTLLRQLGTQLSSGIHPFGGESFEPLRVLIVDAENSRRQVRRKAEILRRSAGAAYPAGGLRFEFRPDGLDLTRSDDVQWLRERVTTNRADVLIIGPLYKLATGDPKDEQTAKAVAYVIDGLRDELGISVIFEAHTPYAEGSHSKRPERPYGASLWSRWPEFGIYLDPKGELRHWRGQREERTWPASLMRGQGQEWPWMAAEGVAEVPQWDGPQNCMAAVLALLKGAPGQSFSGNALFTALKAAGEGFRKPTVAEAAERLAYKGQIAVSTGARNSRLYRFEPVDNPVQEGFE